MSSDAQPTAPRPWPRRILGWAIRLGVGAVLVIVTALLAWAIADRSLPDLEAWHRDVPAGEFEEQMTADGDFTFDDYLALEDRLFAQSSDWMIPADRSAHYMEHSRYQTGGPHDTASFATDWNRSVELVPDEIRGGALLIHGLSDSPYSFRTLAELLHERGFYVLCLRLPGHGTVPAGLLDVTYEDWHAAVDVAARHVAERTGAERPFVVAGFSCGGALATQLAVDAVTDETLRVPDHAFLFSPAIGITAFAKVSNWHKLLSWVPYFEKSKWLGIEPEYDPYKYNSFTKNAGDQMWRLTQATQQDLAHVEQSGATEQLPPFLAFQSVVDATIIARDVADHLFARLPENGSELVVYDVNDEIFMEGLYSEDPRAALEYMERDASRSYRITVVTNRDVADRAVVARSTAPGSSSPTTTAVGLSWPSEVYSMSHVALPLPPDDPLYGFEEPSEPAGDLLPIGRLALRGEKSVLRVPPGQLLRLRSNPFHAFAQERIGSAVDALR